MMTITDGTEATGLPGRPTAGNGYDPASNLIIPPTWPVG